MNQLLRLFAANRHAAARQGLKVNAKAADDEAEILIYDVIVADELEAEWLGGVAPKPFVEALRAIDAKTLHVRINSPGGSVFAGRAIEQALREHPARIVVHVDGVAASAASFVAMAGDEIVMAPGALMMIHKAWGLAIGNDDELRKTADLLGKIDGTLVKTYAERTGQTPEAIADWMAAETWFTAEEAVLFKFADRVAEQPAQAAGTWNLTAYQRAPAAAEKPAAPAAAPTTRPADKEALLRRLNVATLPA